MNFLLLAKLMNKVLLTSHVINSYSPAVNFPDLSKRLNRPVGIRIFNSLNQPIARYFSFILPFRKYQSHPVDGIGKYWCGQNVDRIMYMLNEQ
jgi:hypothetical protein